MAGTSITITIKGDSTDFGRAARDVEIRIAGMEGAAGKAGGKFSQLGGQMQGFAMAGTMALAGTGVAAAGLLGYGVKIAADMEQAKIGFTTMLGSAEKADAFIRDLQAFAAKTPFEFAGLQQSASRMLAVGVEANRVIPIMTVLGDATSAVGTGAEGIDRAVTALTQMQQKGKVTGEEMLQLVEAGIPAWDALASKLGVDVPKAQDMVSKGQVKVNDLFQALETKAGPALQRVSGMMDQQSQTFSGMLSSLKDTFDQQMATLAKPLMEGFKVMLPVITEWASTMITTVTPAIQTASRVLGEFMYTLTSGFTQDEGTEVEMWALRVRDAVITAFTWLTEHKEIIIGALVAIGTVWAIGMGQAAVATIAATWPLLAVIAGITALVAGVLWMWNNWQGFQDFIMNTVVPNWQIIAGVILFLLGPIGMVVAALFYFRDQIPPIIEAVRNAIAVAFEWIQAVAFPWLLNAFSTFQAFLQNTFLPAVQNVWNGILAVINFVVALITPIISFLVDFIRDNFGHIAEIARNIWDMITNIIANAWQVISNLVQFFLNILSGNWSGAWQNIQNIISAVWDTIKNVVSNGVGVVREVIQTLASFVGNIGGRIFEGIATGFRNVINSIIDKWNSPRFTLPSIDLFGKTIGGNTISVPSIPRFQTGGTFHARGGGAGLAILHDGERVIPPAMSGISRAGGSGVTVVLNMPYGFVGSEDELGRALMRALVAGQRAGVAMPWDQTTRVL